MSVKELAPFTSDQLLAEVIRCKEQAERDIESGNKALHMLKALVASPSVLGKILEVACVHFGRSKADLMAETRVREIIFVRHLVQYAANKKYEVSKNEIARYFNQDRATVINAVKSVEEKAAHVPKFKQELDGFLAMLPAK